MAAIQWAMYPNTAITNNMRNYISFVQNTFLSGGWVQTSDTGQLVTANASGLNQYASLAEGYQIFKTGDTVGSGYYAKVEFGAAAASGYPSMWLTIGTSTNGAGTITGQSSTRVQIYSANQNYGITYNCTSGGGSGWVALGMFENSTYYHGFTLERTIDPSGNYTAAGMTMICWSPGNSTYSYQFVPVSGVIEAIVTGTSTIIPSVGYAGSKIAGSTIGLFPIIPYSQQLTYGNMLSVCGSFSTDIPATVTFSLQRYGINHTYYSTGITALPLTMGVAANLILRYE